LKQKSGLNWVLNFGLVTDNNKGWGRMIAVGVTAIETNGAESILYNVF